MDDSSSQDDDSEPMLGLLFKEHQPDQKASNDESADGSRQSGNQSSSSSSATSLNEAPISDSQKLLSLITEIVDFITNFASSAKTDISDSSVSINTVTTTTTTAATNNLAQSISAHQLQAIAELLGNLNVKSTKQLDDSNRNLIETVNKFLRIILDTKLFNDEDGEILMSKFIALITIIETVLNIIIDQTAPDSCDMIKLDFADFFSLLNSLTSSERCKHHTIFLPHAIQWLKTCLKFLQDDQTFSNQAQLECSNDQINMILDATCCLLNYISNILDVLNYISSISSNKQLDSETQDYQSNAQADWVDDGPCFNVGDDDDESLCDDSDDESLCNKLCTFILTQKEFVNQHWYHCHTCNMVDRVGVCTVCAKVCHKDHDVTYAKFGAFFCDCAGRENSTCMALVKRVPATSSDVINPEASSRSSVQRELSSRDKLGQTKNTFNSTNTLRDFCTDPKKINSQLQNLAKYIEPYRSDLVTVLENSNIASNNLELLNSLVPSYLQFAQSESLVGRAKRARAALDELHTSPKSFYTTEALMLPTLGSQEGAFENVRVNYSGEHATLIKSLLSNNTLRRVSMTSLSSPLGKRQHLVVCHEKGKITLLQLNALLRQADSSKRKLTLTRLASAPIPFSVISITANAFNEDVLAICGLKDCHVLTFTQNGLVSSHIELNLDLSRTTDHVIKAAWIPASQTEIAIMTSETIKIYDLSSDSSVPKHQLKLAFGQLRDLTFIVPESGKSRYIIVMDTIGRIFRQELDTRTFGVFYITAELPIPHSNISEKDGRILGGGVSLYYSHSFKMLFFSYANGNYMASMPTPTEVKQVFQLDFDSSGQATFSQSNSPATTPVISSSNRDNSTAPRDLETPKSIGEHHGTGTSQPLCQWTEVAGHVGMIMAVYQNSNNPVIFMLRPDCVYAQEIRYLSIKSKITDATAIRHTTSSGELRTTLILLCEDGSLRIYMASQELTDIWLKLSPISNTMPGFSSNSMMKSTKRRKLLGKSARKSSNADSSLCFSVDFFESLQIMNDVDFGGNDVLSVYSLQQLKNRLNTSGMHITCTKAAGFSIDITNNDTNMVICGLRIQVGSQELSKCPTSIEIFGRTIPISPVTTRWYDLPLTREESLQAEKGLTVSFGPSSDPNNITTIDSIKVYGKSKESFSWPDEGEDQVNAANISGEDVIVVFMGQELGCRFQKLMIHSLQSLENCLSLNMCQKLDRIELEKLAKVLSASLLTVPYPPQVLKTIKSLILSIYTSRQNYNQHRDSVALDFITKSLASFKDDHVDCELFSRLVLIMKALCQSKLSNLTKLSDCLSTIEIDSGSSSTSPSTIETVKIEHLIKHLHELFWTLYSMRPVNIALASVASTSFINCEETLQPLIELIYMATLYDLSILTVATDVIIGFLLSEDLSISLCTRHTLIRLFRDRVRNVQQLEDTNIARSETKANEQERLRQQHLMLLERFIEHLPITRDVGGIRSISFLHVILVLTLDLDCENEVDDAILKNLLHALREELLWNSNQPESLIHRTTTNEVKLVIMRMFSILMSKVRTSSVASAVSSSTRAETNSCWSTFCSSITASALMESNVLDFCFQVLKNMIDHWKETADTNSLSCNNPINLIAPEQIVSINKKTLPVTNSQSLLPDLSPFFLRQYTKGQNSDLFDDYPQLLTEMILRIPYQIKKVSSSSSNNLMPVSFSDEWSTTLCEYLMIPIPSLIKKHVRKLLTFICGSKEKYRQLRDFHFLDSYMRSVKTISGYSDSVKLDEDNDNDVKTTSLNYESMTTLVEHLKSCIEIAQNRCINWQIYCLLKDQKLLPFLMRISLNFDDDVSPIILELLQHALSSSPIATNNDMPSLLETPIITTASVDVITDQTLRDTLTSESLSANLAQQLITSVSKDLLAKFIQSFLLETNLTSLRWQAHSLLYNLWSNFTPEQQGELLSIFWSLWHNLTKYGRKASQFVDLIGFITLRSPRACNEELDKMFCSETLSVLKQQNQLLINHPNAHIYSSIQGLVDLESYYLESEPCSVCNSPEVAYNNIKLSSIKVDSRFTTTTQIIKLIGSHTILKFSLRISDIKRSKMVKTISIYYNNRSVQSVVELKNKSGIWSLARKYSLSPSQTDVKIEFTLPIVACNLMIEFSEFYENFQATSETLQCPRCSTSVSANPGVCSNCGENVFQCHKCRAINYDEKDPFLCISCGFCKYARFDISLTAKPTCAVDPIENEEDRKKTVTSISNLLEKADRVYKNLMQNKPTLELLLLRIHEQVVPDRQFDENILSSDPSSPANSNTVPTSSIHGQSIVVGYAPTQTSSTITSSVNKAIQHLAQKYCVECKGLFEELSKITHKVLASKRELVEYDNRQLRKCLNASSSVLSSANRRKSRVYSSLSSGSGRCYGCATATVEHCITMLKAFSTIIKLRAQICESGVINDLVNFNLRNGSFSMGQDIRQLLCLLTRDDLKSTTMLTELLVEKIEAISKQDYQPFEISHIVRHEIALLAVTLDSDDKCWEIRLRALIKIFAFAFDLRNPTVMECLMIPCLKMLLSIVKPIVPTTRRNMDKSLDNIASVRTDDYRCCISLKEWLNDTNFVFDNWRKRAARPINQGSKQLKTFNSILRRTSKAQSRTNYLAEKYGNRWRLKCGKYNHVSPPISALPNDWLKRLLFNRSSKTVRLMAKSLVEALFAVQSRRGEMVDLLTTYLIEIGPAGECAQEFYYLYENIILSDHWRYYLALQGILFKLGNLITIEIDNLQELEETTLNSSLSLGYSLKMLLELLTAFVTVPKIRSHYKSKLVGLVLKGYLSIRKLVVQRTKVIDESQEMLLELLENMTTGSESETAAFIDVCVEAIKNCHEGDIRTPVFIFERLNSTIHPEENINSEFFVSLEKDPQQEDYLQGRMLGNPYSSNECGIGPLMKDIKNKICQDCELLALLEDDTSMELLVSGKIICLDLPVRDVYKRIWCPENHESDAMRIVYRMRGLLGDATEEFIESLDSRNNESVDEEQVYKMANIMSSSGGLKVMLDRLQQIDDLSPPFKPLLDVILKLFNHCNRTKNNRLKLMSPELKTVEILLNTLKLALNEDDFLDLAGLPKEIFSQPNLNHTSTAKPMVVSTPSPRTFVVDQILGIIETILREASQQPKSILNKFVHEVCGSINDVNFMLNASQALSHRLPHVSHKISQVVPFLSLGDKDKMAALVDYFKSSIEFENFDQEHSVLNDSALDSFCIMVDAIVRNENGDQLKDFIIAEKIVERATRYLTTLAPPLKSSLLATSEEWRLFTSRPALKYVLRILGGLSQGHASTQVLISRDCIPIVHGLEQVSSDAHVGTLAENLLEAIKKHPSVAEKIELVRRQTKEEKKRLAMAVRERQLGALGMKANERGQVTAKSKLLEQCQDLTEDTGLICNICREGYKFQPTKVLGIYTYTKRCVLDEFEVKPRKTYGYTTVTHFNTVHVDCHMSAVRSARSRDEWDSAALQNASTKCNGLLPIWGPQVPESAYANALARHNSYLQESTGYRDIGYHSTIHDIRLQLMRFAQERSFSEDTGGGGPQSNLHLLPYMMQTALYVLNSTKAATREYKRALNYPEMSSNEVLENCYEVDSPYYWCTLALLVLTPSWWKKKRIQFLQRLITCNHVRRVSIKPPAPLSDTRVRAYAYYKSALIFFAFIDGFYNIVFKDANFDEKWNQDWSVSLADYLKNNDQTVNDNIEVLLNLYQNSLLPCTTLERFFEIIRIDEVTQPSEFILNTLESV